MIFVCAHSLFTYIVYEIRCTTIITTNNMYNVFYLNMTLIFNFQCEFFVQFEFPKFKKHFYYLSYQLKEKFFTFYSSGCIVKNCRKIKDQSVFHPVCFLDLFLISFVNCIIFQNRLLQGLRKKAFERFGQTKIN